MAMRGNNARINSSSRGRTIPGQREPRWSPGARAKICSSKKDSSGEESRFYSVRKADPDRVPSTSSLSRVILSSGQRKRTARFLIILKTLLRDVPRHEPNDLLPVSLSVQIGPADSVPATKSPRESVRKKRSGRQRISNGRPSSTRRRPYKANISRRWLACFLLLSLFPSHEYLVATSASGRRRLRGRI